MNNCITGKTGFSLVEMVIVSAIASLFLILLMQVFRQASSSQPKVAANLQLQSTILTGMNKMLRSVREGSHFATPRLNESSPVLVFMDNNGNFRVIFALEDQEYSAMYKKKLFKLVQYTVETKTFNIGGPVHDPDRIMTICRNVVNASFKLSCPQSVTAKVRFANETQEFEIISEVSLMNAGAGT
jgi:prepilin-type N-terminal cleavage/methylation domain-containing protein